jgi:hypothetical protein
MDDQELLRCAQYDQYNGPPNDPYVILTAYAPSASLGAINNFPTFSRRLRTIRYPKDFKPAIEKYDSWRSISVNQEHLLCYSLNFILELTHH